MSLNQRDLLTGASVDVLKPVGISRADTRPSRRSTSETRINGQSTVLGSRVLEMVAHFSLDPSRRVELAHDSAVFALACYMDNPLTDLDLRARRSVRVRRTPGRMASVAALSDQFDNLSAGQVVYTSSLPLGNANRDIPDAVQFMVRASPQGVPNGIYASKLGEAGPVVLHHFGDLQAFYPIAKAGLITQLELAPMDDRIL